MMFITMDQVTSEKGVSFAVPAANMPIYKFGIVLLDRTFQINIFLGSSMQSINGQVGQVKKPDRQISFQVIPPSLPWKANTINIT